MVISACTSPLSSRQFFHLSVALSNWWSTRCVLSPGSEAPEISSEIKASYSADSSAVPWQMLFSKGASEKQISSFLAKDIASFSLLTRCCPHVATWVQQYLHEHLSHGSVGLPLFSLVLGLGRVAVCISALLLRLIQGVSRPSVSKERAAVAEINRSVLTRGVPRYRVRGLYSVQETLKKDTSYVKQRRSCRDARMRQIYPDLAL